jgi:ATP phosphoribosyltransferase
MGQSRGLRTWLSEDLEKQSSVINKLLSLYESQSYRPIEISTLVEKDVLERSNKKFSKRAFQFLDSDGEILSLRTELTQPIAKAIASRAQVLEFPQKLYYSSSVFRYQGKASDDSREIKQVGLEYIGDTQSKFQVDKETLSLFVDSADNLGLDEYLISITDVSIWNRVYEIDPDLAPKIYSLLLSGDLLSFKKLVPFDHKFSSLIGLNNFEEIENKLGLDLSELKELSKLSSKICFNPAQCPDLDLYTGLHFTLFSKYEGSHLAMGGRYDSLCSSFGFQASAIGFAFYIPRILSAIELQKNPRLLRIAVAKGGLFNEAMGFLKSKGLEIHESNSLDSDNKTRKLILKTNSKDLEILMVRGHDVPVYVEHGAADLGIVGLDVILESRADLMQLKDLAFGSCRLSVCAKKGVYMNIYELPNNVRVVSSFPNLAGDFFHSKGIDAEIIELYGSVELGPLTGLSDLIVDLVATGKTLEENGLEEIHPILNCTARLIANKVSYNFYRDKLLALSK